MPKPTIFTFSLASAREACVREAQVADRPAFARAAEPP